MSFYSANLGLGPIRSWGNLFKQDPLHCIRGYSYPSYEPPPVVNYDNIHDLILCHLRDVIDDLDRTESGIITPLKSSHEGAEEDDPSTSVERWSKIQGHKKRIERILETKT